MSRSRVVLDTNLVSGLGYYGRDPTPAVRAVTQSKMTTHRPPLHRRWRAPTSIVHRVADQRPAGARSAAAACWAAFSARRCRFGSVYR